MAKAAVTAAVFAFPLGAMLFVPLWFVMAFEQPVCFRRQRRE